MKKDIFILFLFMALVFSAHSQNLVPNYSFEDTIQCAYSYDLFVGYVSDWGGGGGRGGPCYFNSDCSPSGSVEGVPLNAVGYQEPHSGKAYALIETILKCTPSICPYPPDTNERSYIQAPLASPLKAGVTYYATFYVSLADSCQYACNNMGIYFSDSALTYPLDTFVKSNLSPQIENDPVKNPLTDKVNWTKISGSYKAVGGEKYMIIGNFLPDYKCDTVFYAKGSGTYILESCALYYIDDVILSPDSNYADSLMLIQQLTMHNAQLKVYPNPSKGVFTFESSVESRQLKVEVYNMMGEKVFDEMLKRVQHDYSIDLSGQPAGIYMYRVITETGKLVGEGKLIILHQLTSLPLGRDRLLPKHKRAIPTASSGRKGRIV